MVDQTQEINKKETWELVTNVTMPKDMTFHEGHVVSIVTYTIFMVISGLANITVLCFIIKKRRHSKKSSMMYPMLMNLAIADLLVTFLMMPLEIGWNFTVSWKAGDIMCRIMAFFRIFGLYLSGFVLMCISMDRYYAVLKPFSIPQIKRRGRMMLAAAWIASAVFSAPQIAIFHVEKHPNFTDYEQCVTFNVFKSTYHDLAYKYFGLVMMYGLPLAVIVFCYSSILCKIYRKYKDCCVESDTFRRSSAGFLGRARIRTLKLTIAIVTSFIVCWTPYYVMCLWYWIDRESAQNVDQRIQKALFIFASGNSMMNPIVYGLFNVRASPPQREPNVAAQKTAKKRISPYPDVINGNQDIKPKHRIWGIQHRSLSSDVDDSRNKDGQSDAKKSRFKWRFQSQRSFSSEGTDLADANSMKRLNETKKVATTSADVRRHLWRQHPQRSSLSDAHEFEPNQGKSGWRSWLSHHRVERNASDEDYALSGVLPGSSNTTARVSTYSKWLSFKPKRQSQTEFISVVTETTT